MSLSSILQRQLMKLVLTLSIAFLYTSAYPQNYGDYLGAGHDIGIKVWTSSDEGNATGNKTINGDGLDARKMEAARFFSQSSFGENMASIEALADNLDFSGWIDAQFQLERNLLLPRLWSVNERSRQLFYQEREPGSNDEYFGPWAVHFSYAWWDHIKKSPDQLRQRIAYALSQIFVISSNSELESWGEAMASFYDILIRNAFGNYKDIMMEVSLHPAMGFYLSHFNNRKADPTENTQPDQNYAREIMQLFSIGLYELNNDGTRKTQNGQWIPTYDNSDIEELAKIFTGLSVGAYDPDIIAEYGNIPLEFGVDIYSVDKTVPMAMYEAWHSPGDKTIIGGYLIPGAQGGMTDIQQAVTHLFNHPNVAPFVANKLIQRLVKSNPTPAYINRVANAFNNNGNGIRGDMKAVIKAILLDPEARECSGIMDPESGKMREPVLRYTQVMRTLPSDSPNGNYWNDGFSYYDETKQVPLRAPSVFNFYLPDHQPVGDFADQGLYAPEFQLFNSQTSIGYVNQANRWAIWQNLMWDWHSSTEDVDVVLSDLEPYAEDPESIINRLDILFTHGRMSETTRDIIRTAIRPLMYGNYRRDRTALALYLTLISPDYVILK